jgi:hypothetical protein
LAPLQKERPRLVSAAFSFVFFLRILLQDVSREKAMEQMFA